MALLVLIDLSAAVDLVPQKSLLHILENDFGITEKALAWFTSYLDNRFQRIRVGAALSDLYKMNACVPQGSSLGPIRFIFYASSLAKVVERLNIEV